MRRVNHDAHGSCIQCMNVFGHTFASNVVNTFNDFLDSRLRGNDEKLCVTCNRSSGSLSDSIDGLGMLKKSECRDLHRQGEQSRMNC